MCNRSEGLYLNQREARSLKTTFSREVTSCINDIMEPYSETTTDQRYLEFIDHTQELVYDYEKGTTDCIRLPSGTLVTENHPSFFKKYILQQGKVFQRDAGPLHHMKRTKRAKRMRAMLCYPNKKLYPDFQSFADDGWIPFKPVNKTFFIGNILDFSVEV